MKHPKGRAHYVALMGLLLAMTFALSFMEAFIVLPINVPGVKLGLANITVLLALYALDVRSAVVLMVSKVILSGFLFGSLMTVAYSAAGSICAFGGMWFLSRSTRVGVVATSVVAAILHNIGQVCMAVILLSTPALLLNLPVLVIAACFTGTVTGVGAEVVVRVLPVPGKSGQGIHPNIL